MEMKAMRNIATVYLARDEHGAWTIAGWVWDRKAAPEGAWFRNAEEDWAKQIVEFVRTYPIKVVQVKVKNQPLREVEVVKWLRKQGEDGLAEEVAARTFRERNITRL